jgi:porin
MNRSHRRLFKVVVACAATIFGSYVASANEADVSDTDHAALKHPNKKEHSLNGRNRKLTRTTSVLAKLVEIKSTQHQQSLEELNAIYNFKGWDIPFPSYSDTIIQDYGGIRTALAAYGFGFTSLNISLFELNMLSGPSVVPPNFPRCTTPLGGVCAGGQTYFGQRPSVMNEGTSFLSYDLSRWGIPDGQFVIAGQYIQTGDQAFLPNYLGFNAISWYQTLFDKRVEIKVGLVPNNLEWIGSAVGGNLANPFGGAASIPAEFGQSPNYQGTPTARSTWHMTDKLYDEIMVQRSLPVDGPTGNPLYDESRSNPIGLRFSSPTPGTRELFMDEVGYKQGATPTDYQTWLRFGVLYNTSAFKDFSKLLTDPTATRSGNGAVYFYGDRQIWQQDPSSPWTAYRGIYAGVAAMYAPPEVAAFSQYYEGRAYWYGPFDSRPTDMLSLVYFHNVVSHYVADATNLAASQTGIYGRNATNTVTLSYTAHVSPGIYGTVGVQYTDHPSITYFRSEGSSLNFLASIFYIL